VTANSNGVSVSVGNYLTSQSNQALSAANGSFTFQTATFANSNGVSFSTGTQGIYATVQTNYLTTARASNDAVGLNTAQSNVTWTVNSSGISLDARGYAGTATGATNASVTVNSGGVSVSVGPYITSQSNQALSGSNGSFAFQTATFGNLNGLSFYTSNGSLVGSYTVPTVTNSSWTVSDSATSGSVARLAFTNLNGVTLSLSSGTGGSHTIVGSHNALTSQSNQALSAANGSFTFQTATFANSNGISFSTGTQGLYASHNGLTTARASNDAVGLNTAQSNVTWTVNSSGISLDGRGYAGTGTSATNASITLNSNGLAISVAPGGGVNPVASASNGSFSFTTLGFSNANNVTFGTSAGSIITASVAAPGAAAENNWVNLLGANTAGNTTASGSTIGYSGINLTLSGTNGSVVNISAPATSSLSATGAVSISTNGSTISIGAPAYYTAQMFPTEPLPFASSSMYSGATNTTAGGSVSSMSMYISPFFVDKYVSYDQVLGQVSYNTVAGTGSWTAGMMYGLYTDNAGTLSSVSTWMFAARLSQNSVTAHTHYIYWGNNSAANNYGTNGNISASFNGLRAVLLQTGASSLTPGNYYLVQAMTMSTAGAAIGSLSGMHVSMSQSTMGSIIGTNVSSRHMPFLGIASTTVTSNAAHIQILPAAINSTAITGTGGSSQNRYNAIFFANT
jgi:hypothetical protein